MAQYTKLLDRDMQEIAHQYELKLTDYAPITGGAANSSYLLNTREDKYILTICEASLTFVTRMSQVLLLLAEHEFPAPRIQPLANGRFLTSCQGKPVFLKPYIRGQVIKDLNNVQLGQIGTAMAQLHEIPAPNYLPDGHFYVVETYPLVMKTGIDQIYLNGLKQRYEFLMKSMPANLPVGLIHGDLFYDNVLFEEGKLKALLDFEEVCHSYKMFDMGMAIVGLCTDNTKILLEKVSAFVNGYQTVRVLEKDEKESLKLFVELAALLTSAWRYWKYNIDVPDAAKATKHVQMVNIANEANAIPQSVWQQVVPNFAPFCYHHT